MREDVFTASPNSLNLGLRVPTTPAMTLPLLSPILMRSPLAVVASNYYLTNSRMIGMALCMPTAICAARSA